MSDTPRTYGGGGLGTPSRRRRVGGMRLIRLLALVVVAGAAGYAYWVARDTYSVYQMMPPHLKYWVAVQDIADKRQKIAESQALKSLSEVFGLEQANAVLNREIPVPQWVVNNLAGQTCFITGNDLAEFSDVLIISKMTPLGALLQRFHSVVSATEDDYAGGLRLKRLPEQGLFFASRGRVLMASPDREALIRALTLPATRESANGNSWGAIAQSGIEDLQGRMTLDADDPMGPWVESLSFALHIDDNHAILKWRATLRSEVREQFARLAEEAQPRELLTPPDGLVAISADFGKPVEKVWADVAGAVGATQLAAGTWDRWRTVPQGGRAGLSQMLTAVLEGTGPGIRLSWRGVDLNEMFPVPEIVGVFEARGKSLESVYASFPPVPDGAKPWEEYPRYDAKARRMHLPMIGGPSLKPTAIQKGTAILVSTSSSVADTLLAETDIAAPLPRPANLYIRVRPDACIEAVGGVGRLMAQMDTLRGYDEETFEEAMRNWTRKASGIEELSALVSLDRGNLLGELTLATRLTQTDGESVSETNATRKEPAD